MKAPGPDLERDSDGVLHSTVRLSESLKVAHLRKWKWLLRRCATIEDADDALRAYILNESRERKRRLDHGTGATDWR